MTNYNEVFKEGVSFENLGDQNVEAEEYEAAKDSYIKAGEKYHEAWEIALGAGNDFDQRYCQIRMNTCSQKYHETRSLQKGSTEFVK